MNIVRRECVWALTNALSSATLAQVEQIINFGFFTAANYALEINDHRIIFVTLEGVIIALKKGQNLPLVDGENPFVLKVEATGLLDKIEDL